MTFPAILFMIIGILCVLYGIAVFLIRSGTMFYAVWLALGTCFLLMSFLIRIRFFDKLPKIARALLLIAAAAVIVLFLICEGFVLRGFGSRAPEGLDYLIVLGAQVREDGPSPEGLDYLIVLGAQVREDGPSAVLKYRLDAAVDYLKENESTLCIVTGGKGEDEPLTEGEGMKQYLTAQGIDPARILVEDQARNTVQNIQFSKQLMTSPGASTALVTNNFHVTRATALARKQGLTNVYAIAAPSDPVYLPNNMFREFFGLTKDFLAGNL